MLDSKCGHGCIEGHPSCVGWLPGKILFDLVCGLESQGTNPWPLAACCRVHLRPARPVEHHKTSSAEQPADDFGAVVLKGLLADREWQ